MDYFRHVSGQPLRDPYELSHTPRASVPYEPRACDLVEFEADERVQHVVLASPSAHMHTPHAAHVAAESDSAGRSRRDRLSESYE